MPRRRMIAEPPSRLAHWSRRVALFALLVALFALVLARAGVVEQVPGMVILGAAVALALAGAALGLVALGAIWFNGNPGTVHALFGVCAGLAVAAYPLYVAAEGLPRPAIHDVTTDPADPPAFEAIVWLRAADANPLDYAAANLAGRQRAAYPDIVPLEVETPPERSYALALAAVNRQRWSVVEARAFQAGQRDGHIEAVARSPLMGFRDDVVLRVRAGPAGGAVIDIRSAARHGTHDLGSNAARVRGLMADIGSAAAHAARR